MVLDCPLVNLSLIALFALGRVNRLRAKEMWVW
jgi:hypothetical protein